MVAILASPATVIIHSGSKSQSFSAKAEVNFFVLQGFMEGQQSIQVVRNGKTQLCGVGNISINNTIDKYNFNAVVGDATIGACSNTRTEAILFQKAKIT